MWHHVRSWVAKTILLQVMNALVLYLKVGLETLQKRTESIGQTKKVSISTNIGQNFTGRRSVFFLQIFYKHPATDSDVSDVDKRPWSIDKSDVSTSLTGRRRPQQSTLFSSNTVTDTAAIFSRLKGRHRQDAHGALSWSKDSVSNRHCHQACMWTTLRSPLHVHCTMYYVCMRAYKKFSVEAWKKFVACPSKCSRSG